MRFSLVGLLASVTLIRAGLHDGLTFEYSLDLAQASNVNWMANIPNEALVSSLSIPGTHNTMTSVIPDLLFQCQNTDIEQQLKAGIRYFDLTLGISDRVLYAYHAGFNTHLTLADTMGIAARFLDQNPSEALIVRVQKESLKFGSKKDFESAMIQFWKTPGVFGRPDKSYVYTAPGGIVSSAPTLGALRGKILIVEDFHTSTPGALGLPWKSTAFSIPDTKIAIGRHWLNLKWLGMKVNLELANKEMRNKLHITHTTVSIGAEPVTSASGDGWENKGMNDRLGKYLMDGNVARTGIVVMDFPGKKLVNLIISRNIFRRP
ncbi:hypothetical protein BROUX41_002143 [Berkeleyomyces rouxiae]|uniref:uncharacterized protein n=1 Tax=Berkeleyomyces rouxiae TaxID=2035830 RepID=UPI003B796863